MIGPLTNILHAICLAGGHGLVAVDLNLTHPHRATMPAFLLAAVLAAIPAEPPATAPPLTAAQAELLQRIKRLRDGDSRTFGSCTYRWDQWRPQPTGSRTTTVTGCGTASVAVACTALKLSTLPVAEPQVWSPWRLPEPGPEERMVVSLCANALPLPAPAPAVIAPKPEKQQKAAKP